MGVKDPGKLRLWRIAELLNEKTDENHMLTGVQIQNYLEEHYGLESNLRTIHADIRFLNEMGMGIEQIRSVQWRYFIPHRLFELPELQLLIDAVQSSRFITEKKSEALTEKLLTFASEYGAQR